MIDPHAVSNLNEPERDSSGPDADHALLNVRLAVILLLGVLAGLAAALLTYLAYGLWPTAALAGGGAAVATIKTCHALIGH